ncbi:MAG: hypothetical protein RIC30_02670 [Marinoscillum sp.]|uniref:Uncharacterized protein n=1 Tax=Marinoscillum luteum TaxID=861051 RepID=A0ABW7N2M3_9BACT|nr:hypothetical protein [Marinoscillum sp. 108]VXD12604.1 conserved hypothetical protein [Marinoscillum sp. 108]
MKVKASNFKNWCTENISPQSWTRICLKCVDEIRAKGYNLKQMEDLDPDVDLDAELLTSLSTALETLYEMSVDESLLIRY